MVSLWFIIQFKRAKINNGNSFFIQDEVVDDDETSKLYDNELKFADYFQNVTLTTEEVGVWEDIPEYNNSKMGDIKRFIESDSVPERDSEENLDPAHGVKVLLIEKDPAL